MVCGQVEGLAAWTAVEIEEVVEGRELEGDERLLKDGSSHSLVANPLLDADLLIVVVPQHVFDLQHGVAPQDVAHQHDELRMNYGGKALQEMWMAGGDAYLPYELDSRLKQVSSLTPHLPILAFVLDQQTEVFHHCVLQLRPQQQPKRKQEPEHHLQCHQGWKYLGDGIDEDTQPLVTRLWRLQVGGLLCADCFLDRKAQEQGVQNHSYHSEQQPKRMKDQNQRS